LKRSSLYFFLLLLGIGCHSEGPTSLCPGIEYEILAFEGSSVKIEEGDVVYTSIFLEDEKFPQEWASQIFVVNNDESRLEGNLTKFEVGDSLALNVDNDYFPSQYYYYNQKFILKIDSLLKRKGIKFKKLEERKRLEQVEIAQYIFSKGLTYKNYKRGVFILDKTRRNNLENLKYGDPILLHYKTYLMNGKLIASSEEMGPMEFTLGQSGQVLPGTAKAISLCSYGDRIKVLVPSDLAYGAKGSGAGIVPPFSPLIMEVECVLPKPKSQE